MKRILLALGVLLGLSVAAQAQAPCGVNFVPTVGVICATLKQNTYSAVAQNLVPAAAATDILCISSSASKSLSIAEVDVSGILASGTASPLISIVHHTVLDTGGTGASGAAAPVAFSNVSTNPASTAVLSAFTANPTINDTSPALVRNVFYTMGTSAAVAQSPLFWLFGTAGTDEYLQRLDQLKNVTGQYCVNLNGATLTASLAIAISWTEN